jgi:DNA-binding transcriptional MocR family regulator
MNEQTHDREMTQATAPAHVIDLGIGHPGLSLLPVDLIDSSARPAFEAADPRMLQYGYEQGTAEFRAALAGFLERTTGTPVDSSTLFVSGGVSQALHLLSSLFTRPGDLVLVEEPTYFLALRIFADHGLRVRSIPTDSSGLDVDALESVLREESPAIVYTVPVHQNPSGVTLSAERRARLVELARRHDFFILADEVYQLLTYDGTPPSPFGVYAGGGNVCSLGSFSKILAPGLRMGWIQAHGDIIERIVKSGFLDSGGGLAPFTSALLTRAVTDHSLDRHVERLRTAYRARREALLSALGDRLRVSRPDGGYFVWAELPAGQSARRLLSRAEEAGVSFVPGPRFSATESLENCLRISFSYYEPEAIAEGAGRLLSVL